MRGLGDQAQRRIAAHVAKVRTHGLATTGVEMLYSTGFATVDSESWSLHSRKGVVDLYVEKPGGRLVYRGAHISVERNAFDEATHAHIVGRPKSFRSLSPDWQAEIVDLCSRYPSPETPFPFARP
jgi:hypothetical protein